MNMTFVPILINESVSYFDSCSLVKIIFLTCVSSHKKTSPIVIFLCWRYPFSGNIWINQCPAWIFLLMETYQPLLLCSSMWLIRHNFLFLLMVLILVILFLYHYQDHCYQIHIILVSLHVHPRPCFCQSCNFKNTCRWSGIQKYPVLVIWVILLALILCGIVCDLKVECTYMIPRREILREVTWFAIVVARRIQSCPVLTRDQKYFLFCSYFLLSKGVPHEIFVLAPDSTPVVLISWRFLVSPNPTFFEDQMFQWWCGSDKILIPSHIIYLPQLLKQETIPILGGNQKETHCLHLVNIDHLLLLWHLVSRYFEELINMWDFFLPSQLHGLIDIIPMQFESII